MKKWRVLILLVLAIGTVWGIWRYRDQKIREEEAWRNEVILSVAIGADVHNELEILSKMVKNETGVVVLAGDVSNSGGKKELMGVKNVLEASGKEYYVVPGNHDWWNQKVNAGVWTEVFGQKYQSFHKEGIKFILVDNGNWQGLGEEQWNWLRGEVGECRQVRCLVVMHMPINHLISSHVMGEDNSVVKLEAKELLKLLTDNGVKEYFAGHLHYADSYEIGGLRTNLVGAMNRARSRKVEYTLLKVKREGWDKEIVKIEL